MALINISNHPSSLWSTQQMKAAEKMFGGVIDVAFPSIDPSWTPSELLEKLDSFLAELSEKYTPLQHYSFHVMGEFNFCFALVSYLIQAGADVYASTTERHVSEEMQGDIKRKVTIFEFVQFRKYVLKPISQYHNHE
ncbi:MAG: hypothetical protein ACK4EX_03790 [Thermaurantimonas sp.]|uniref:hypothetical protein n=1 Tax=Thermaurantimonas sp. TaxID=2681568 RepID=UPI003918A7F8